MTFTQKFDDYVCIGDTITCTVDGYTVTAPRRILAELLQGRCRIYRRGEWMAGSL